jgi:hypothetical protein
MEPSWPIQGRSWSGPQLQQIAQWVAERANWSRYRLSRELCLHGQWVRPNGQLADMAARSFLNKLQQRKLIELPPLRRRSPNRMKHRRLECVALDSRPVVAELRQLGLEPNCPTPGPGLAGQVWAWHRVGGNVRGPEPLWRRLLCREQLAGTGSNPRSQPRGSRPSTAGPSQSRLCLWAERPSSPKALP